MLKFYCAYFLFLIISIKASRSDTHLLKSNIISANFKDDTTKVNKLILASKNNFNTDPQKAVSYGLQANTLATKIRFKSGSAYALKNVGIAYYILGNYEQTLNYWQQSLKTFRAIGDKLGEANLLSNLGVLYLNQGDAVKSLDFHLKSLKVSEQLGDKLRIATSLINIGAVYYNNPATHQKALQYYLRALPITEEINDKNAIGTSSVNLGEIYLEQGNDSLALFYFQKSLQAYKGSENIPYSLNSIAKVYLKRKDFKAATNYHNQALKIAENLNGQLDIAQSLLGLAETMALQGKPSKAIVLYKQSAVISKKLNYLSDLKIAYKGLALSNARIFDFEQAFQYETLYSGVKDSLYNAESDKKLSGLQFDFEIQKKQGEINLLVKSKALQQLELKRQRNTQNSLIVGLLLVFIIAFILFRNYQIKSKTNKLLDKQKAEIEILLSNMLPEIVAKELQNDGFATPRYYESVSVFFSDFKDFTQMADALSPQEVVLELNTCFMAFDDIIEKNGLEKIKTIGDSYMCAGGVPAIDETHPQKMLKASLEIKEFMNARNKTKIKQGQKPWELRMGVHTGPIVAGVVGKKKFAYDIWGSTVNIASRMESNGEAGKVNISAATYELVKEHFLCTYRGKIFAKNVGDIDMYFVESALDHRSKVSLEQVEESADL